MTFPRRRFLHFVAGVAVVPIASRMARAQGNPASAPLAERLAGYAHGLSHNDLDDATIEQIRNLAAERGLNRELEALPSDKEIRRRMETGLGLTSPELATLMAHVKLALKEDVLGSDLPDQEVFAGRLPDYFPEELRDRAWGLVLDALYWVPQEIEQLVEKHQEPDAEEPSIKY